MRSSNWKYQHFMENNYYLLSYYFSHYFMCEVIAQNGHVNLFLLLEESDLETLLIIYLGYC